MFRPDNAQGFFREEGGFGSKEPAPIGKCPTSRRRFLTSRANYRNHAQRDEPAFVRRPAEVGRTWPVA